MFTGRCAARHVRPRRSKRNVEDMAGEKCKPAFATYVGLGLGQSRLDFDFVTPDEITTKSPVRCGGCSRIGHRP